MWEAESFVRQARLVVCVFATMGALALGSCGRGDAGEIAKGEGWRLLYEEGCLVLRSDEGESSICGDPHPIAGRISDVFFGYAPAETDSVILSDVGTRVLYDAPAPGDLPVFVVHGVSGELVAVSSDFEVLHRYEVESSG